MLFTQNFCNYETCFEQLERMKKCLPVFIFHWLLITHLCMCFYVSTSKWLTGWSAISHILIHDIWPTRRIFASTTNRARHRTRSGPIHYIDIWFFYEISCCQRMSWRIVCRELNCLTWRWVIPGWDMEIENWIDKI